MVGVGEAFVNVITLSATSFIEFTAPAGESYKILQVNAVSDDQDRQKNTQVGIKPADGQDEFSTRGVTSSNDAFLLIGSPTDSPLQPILATDTRGVYLGNDADGARRVTIQGVRIA